MFTKTSAFTLIELLVVIVIIGILATIGLAQFNEYQEKARFAKAQAFASQSDTVLMAETMTREHESALKLDFETGTGDTAFDTSGSQNDFDVSHANFTWVADTPDNSQYALDINGQNTWTTNIANMPSNEASFSTFVKLDQLPTTHSVLPFYIANNSAFFIYPNGQARFVVDWGPKYVMSPTGKIKAGRWHHLLGSYKDGKLRLFVDGDLMEEKDVGTLAWPFNINSATGLEYTAIYLGYIGSSEAFEGVIDRVRVYPVGLDPSQL